MNSLLTVMNSLNSTNANCKAANNAFPKYTNNTANCTTYIKNG